MRVGATDGRARNRRAAAWFASAALLTWAGPASGGPTPEDAAAGANGIPAVPAPDVEDPAAAGEIDLDGSGDGEADELWGPNRLGFGMTLGMALWHRDRLGDPRYLWDGNGEALLAMQCDYHRMFGDWVGLGGTVWFPTNTAAYFLTGLAVSVGPRVYLWPDWVYVQVEAVAGYPPIVGAIGTVGLSFPFVGGARFRLESQFWLNILEDEAEYAFGWFPAFAAEMGF